MKILIVVSTLSFGGAERSAGNVSSILSRQHDVAVLVLHGNITYPHGGTLIDLGLPYQPEAGLIGKIGKFYNKFVGVRHAINQFQPDVTIFFAEGPAIIGLWNKLAWIHTKVVTNTQIPPSQMYTGINAPLYNTMIRGLYHRADANIALSQGVKQELSTQFNVPPTQIEVIYNPIDLYAVQQQSFEPVTEAPFGTETPVIVAVGRLAEQKNYPLLLHAFAHVRRQTNVTLAIIGQGPLEDELHALTAQLDIADAVTFLGWQANPFKFMRASTLFVLSSGFEGFGNVIVEAIACGCPVIATDCDYGPREILRSDTEQFGVLTPVNDEDALAKSMLDLLNDPVARNRLIQKGYKRAEAFAFPAIEQRYDTLLEKIRAR
ncbi:MAG: glycosyltransferase [Anaerolineae bacterium]|nr:glycosyltransferase [Anaerolineae bacterium]